MPNPRFEALLAIASNGVIGRDQSLPWRLKADLVRFKRLTMGHSLLMGRKTYESIGRPLPGRRTWVLTRRADLDLPGCEVISHWEQALGALKEDEKLFLVGGADVYRQLLDQCSVLHITHVLGNVQGDACLEPVDTQGYRLVEALEVPADETNEFPTRYERWEVLGED